MEESNSEITPHEVGLQQGSRFVASGGTCTCSMVKQHGRLLLKKLLLPEMAADQRHRQALEKEFEIGYALNHPNIPRYLEFHEDFILMEYVDGLTLSDFVLQNPAYFKRRRHVKQFLEELLSAVDYLHRHQVLHLDLKPDNIMMTHIGNHVKLIDLGYCYQDGFPFSTGGTLGYAAPEKEKTAASDIYSLGRIFSELGITGERIVDKCLRAEPFERYQSIDELVAALRKRHILRVALISILLVLLFGVGVWCWLDKRGTETMGKASVTVENLSESAIPKDTMSDMAISSPEPSTFPPGKTERDVPQPSQNDTNTFTAMEDRDVVSKEEDLLLRNQMKAFPLFEHVTDSILTELKQFVADDRMPYKLGGLEAYRLRYDSLKSKAIDCGKRSDKVPFWMHSHWTVYNGKPKPYNIFDNYLYQQMASIETLFQTHAVNYKLNQKFEQNDSSQP